MVVDLSFLLLLGAGIVYIAIFIFALNFFIFKKGLPEDWKSKKNIFNSKASTGDKDMAFGSLITAIDAGMNTNITHDELKELLYRAALYPEFLTDGRYSSYALKYIEILLIEDDIDTAVRTLATIEPFVGKTDAYYFAQGEILFKKKDYGQAVKIFRDVGKNYAYRFRAEIYLGLCYFKTLLLSKAHTILKKSLKEDIPYYLEDDVKFAYASSLFQSSRNNFDFINFLAPLQQKRKWAGPVAILLGKVYARNGNQDGARSILEEVRSILPANAGEDALELRYLLARQYINRRKYDEAQECLKEIIDTDSSYKDVEDLFARNSDIFSNKLLDKYLSGHEEDILPILRELIRLNLGEQKENVTIERLESQSPDKFINFSVTIDESQWLQKTHYYFNRDPSQELNEEMMRAHLTFLQSHNYDLGFFFTPIVARLNLIESVEGRSINLIFKDTLVEQLEQINEKLDS